MKLKMIIPILCFAAAGCTGGKLTSGLNLANMNDSIAPGEDFYEYASGGWMKANPLKPEYSSFGQFDVLSDNNILQLKEMFEEYANTEQEHGTLGQKIGSIYRMAMDSVKRNEDGYKPIMKDLEYVRNIASREEFQLANAVLGKKGVDIAMFGIYCDADLSDASKNLVQTYQGGLGLGNKDYYMNEDEASKKIMEAYKTLICKLFTMIGHTEKEAAAKMENILSIEYRIARASKSRTELRDVPNNFHKMSYADLKTDFPGIMWDEILSGLGYPEIDSVSVGQPEQLHEVERIFKEVPLQALKDYAEFGVVYGATSMLSDDFRAVAFEFSQVLSGAQEDKPRWKRAVGAVNGVLGMPVGKLYVEKYFPESSKQRMLKLVNNLKDALRQRIEQLTWMSDSTKAQAYDKLSNFIVKIGYPDTWRDYSKLMIDDTLSYYENMCNASEFYLADMIDRKVGKPVDKTEWLMTPQTINAYYNPTTNEICFPAGILQPPFFNPEADDAANYGAIGVVIGHEMSHGFDDQGCLFDKNGNMHNWWTAEDKAKFDERTAVLADFFSTQEVLPGVFINGKLTLGENIGDNGGLNIAYQAFLNAMEQNPLGEKDGFTPQQRFFISYGFIWATNFRDEYARNQVLNDPHSNARFRVNAALPQIDAWYEAFGIKEGDKLYIAPEKRARIW